MLSYIVEKRENVNLCLVHSYNMVINFIRNNNKINSLKNYSDLTSNFLFCGKNIFIRSEIR